MYDKAKVAGQIDLNIELPARVESYGGTQQSKTKELDNFVPLKDYNPIVKKKKGVSTSIVHTILNFCVQLCLANSKYMIIKNASSEVIEAANVLSRIEYEFTDNYKVEDLIHKDKILKVVIDGSNLVIKFSEYIDYLK